MQWRLGGRVQVRLSRTFKIPCLKIQLRGYFFWAAREYLANAMSNSASNPNATRMYVCAFPLFA